MFPLARQAGSPVYRESISLVYRESTVWESDLIQVQFDTETGG